MINDARAPTLSGPSPCLTRRSLLQAGMTGIAFGVLSPLVVMGSTFGRAG